MSPSVRFSFTSPLPAFSLFAVTSTTLSVTLPGIPGNVTDKVVEVTANSENAGSGEVKENLTDGDIFSKWLVFEPTGWVVYKLSEPEKVVLYALGPAHTR